MDGERKTDDKIVLFPVEKRSIYFREAGTDLFGKETTAPTYHQVPRFEAVVDVERNYTFAVVSERYRLVTNNEALKLGKRCFQRVFSEATAGGMELFNVIQPNTRSFCHVDFIHKGHSIKPLGDNDKWWPYLRVTNSYNRMKPLRFDLGFCRAICTNGVIFSGEHIVFRYYHTSDQIDLDGEFEVDATRLRRLETVFVEQMNNLKRYYVPHEHMLGLACKTFDIGVTEEDLGRARRRDQLLDFKAEITRLTSQYFQELGPNGYAALNVLTDFAARPRIYISGETMIDPLQKRCGDWTVGFLRAIQEPGFDFVNYLGPFGKASQLLENADRAMA